MKVHLDCFPCFLKQAIIAGRLATDDYDTQIKVIKAVLPVIEATVTSKPPSYSTTFLHRAIRQALGKDPFAEVKKRYNQVALSLYPRLVDLLQSSTNPLQTALRLAIAGNIIDFGIYTTINIDETIERALHTRLEIDFTQELIEAIKPQLKILYLLDNAGEIVFDRLLIEQLIKAGAVVTAVVKGSAVLNDATIEDAKEVGLDKVCRIIDNGSDCIGTTLEFVSEEFLKEFYQVDLIISKGQGNFESLFFEQDLKGRAIFYLLQAKCDVVAKELAVSKSAMLLCKHLS